MGLETLNNFSQKLVTQPTNNEKNNKKKRKYNVYVLKDEDRDEVKNLCIKNVPFWNNLTHDDIEVEIITFAVTNLVFTATLKCTDKTQYPYTKLVLKKKSSFNTLLYDTDLQYEVAKLLGGNNCGPKVIGRFGDITIQEWIEGETTTNYSFKNISVVASLASSLAKFHKKGTELAPKEWDRTPFVIRQLNQWSKHIDRIIKKYNVDFDYNELMSLVELYKKVIDKHSKSSKAATNSILFCHNDLFYKNILEVQHGLFFLDFDYSGFNYVGWDIATFLKKLCVVYNKPDYPYLDVDDSLYLSDDLLSVFVSVYLSQLLDKNVLPSDMLVKEFLDSIEIHSLGIHLFWSFWNLMMMDRPSRESTVVPAFYPESQLHYDFFKKQLKKLKENKLIEI